MSQFLLQFREATRRLHLADSTEQSYTNWVKRYILYHGCHSAEAISRAQRIKTWSGRTVAYLRIPRLKSVKALQNPLDEREAEALLSRLELEMHLLAALMYDAVDGASDRK